jgi:hypothetical protein
MNHKVDQWINLTNILWWLWDKPPKGLNMVKQWVLPSMCITQWTLYPSVMWNQSWNAHC